MIIKNLRAILLTLVAVLVLGGQAFAQTSGSDQPTLKQMTVDDVELTYQEQGQGETVIFVHGAFSDHRVWEAQREEIVAQGYRYIAPDLRYHGGSPWPEDSAKYVEANSQKYVLGTFSNDLAELVWHLGGAPVHVVGWSLGGSIALDFAVQYPQLVRSLVLYEPALSSIVSDPADLETFGKEGEGLGPVFAAIEANNLRKGVRLFAGWVNAQTFDAIEPSRLKPIFLENSQTLALLGPSPADPPIICAQLGQIAVPVTVMKGQQTRPIFDIVADTTHECIPDSQIVTISNARHLGPAENPSGFNEALLSHLERN